MPTDLRIVMPNQPGRCERMLRELAEAGINLDGICGDIRPGETWGFLHLLVEEADKAAALIEASGLEITSRHLVNIHELEDRPGAIAETLRAYADGGENVEVIYTISRDRIVVGSDMMRQPIMGVRVKDAKY